MKLHDYAIEHGNHAAARAIINKWMMAEFGKGIDHFLDLQVVANCLAKVEKLIADGVYNAKMPVNLIRHEIAQLFTDVLVIRKAFNT